MKGMVLVQGEFIQEPTKLTILVMLTPPQRLGGKAAAGMPAPQFW
jgi:hypothetical protein